MRHSLQILNCMERVATTTDIGLRADDAEGPVRDAKVALLESIWNAQEWGDVEAFRNWAVGARVSVSSDLQQLFHEIAPSCPAR